MFGYVSDFRVLDLLFQEIENFFNKSEIDMLQWGPERPLFSVEKPAPYPSFNSITNDPHLGDERNFVRIREVGEPKFRDGINIFPNREYEVQVYFHNNARDDLNYTGQGAALNTKLKVILPNFVEKNSTVDISAIITSDNTLPNRVFDHTCITACESNINIKYVIGSASITSNGGVNSMSLDYKRLFGEGHLLGYSALNGIVPGCYQYSGSVRFRFRTSN